MRNATARRIYDLMNELQTELEKLDSELEYQNNLFLVNRRILIRALKNFKKFF